MHFRRLWNGMFGPFGGQHTTTGAITIRLFSTISRTFVAHVVVAIWSRCILKPRLSGLHLIYERLVGYILIIIIIIALVARISLTLSTKRTGFIFSLNPVEDKIKYMYRFSYVKTPWISTKFLLLETRRCLCCNVYRCMKWTRGTDFKSWTRLFEFHLA